MAVWVTWPALTKLGTLGVMAGLITLAVERGELFKNNLFDLENYGPYNAAIKCDDRSLTARTEDGTCNILSNPAEGSVYRRFGRNEGDEPNRNHRFARARGADGSPEVGGTTGHRHPRAPRDVV